MAPRKTATATEAPATEAPEAPATEAPATEAPKRHKAPAIKAEDVKVTGMRAVTDANPFARGDRRIPEDDQILQAFRQSYDNKAPVELDTPDPDAVVKWLRRIAAQETKGVRIRALQESVIFQATDRKKMNKKAKTEETVGA
ncbi:hypothetical protein Toil_gp05 [Rhodococcus phage Toil]|uniref:Uncharacterized protein n=1 Tax=Rhodococcus phage Toil TaxID=1975614 RepID=A0A1W6DXQ5_9VIRU|nr:hypothetical protein KMD62_gp05 [Rhodococcus phage Toil]ARK07688.1 hypothetical protein Toil_gp05 [Rhodococcus phage Toil]